MIEAYPHIDGEFPPMYYIEKDGTWYAVFNSFGKGPKNWDYFPSRDVSEETGRPKFAAEEPELIDFDWATARKVSS